MSASGSLTLEAALVLTLFVFASMLLILPMRMMTTERRIQAALEAAGEDLSRYAYIRDAAEKGTLMLLRGADAGSLEMGKGLDGAAALAYVRVCVMGQIDSRRVQRLSLARSEFLEDGKTIDLILDYEISMPFPVLGLEPLPRSARCRRRAWIGGAEGEGSNGEGDESGNEIVYIGKNSTRYHLSRSCHYLSNQLLAVPWESVGERRNNSGGIYYACKSCAQGTQGGIVYIMAEGSSFHTNAGCRSITAYVQAVRRREVEHLGACSYCGG